MPLCRLKKTVYINGQAVEGFSFAVLLQEGDRWSVYDPGTENELVKGMTESFKELLIRKGLLTLTDVVPEEAL